MIGCKIAITYPNIKKMIGFTDYYEKNDGSTDLKLHVFLTTRQENLYFLINKNWLA
jgi:hypothetical protein